MPMLSKVIVVLTREENTIDHLTSAIYNLTKIVSANEDDKSGLARDIARFVMQQQINLERITKEYDALKMQLDDINNANKSDSFEEEPKSNIIQFPR